MKINVSCDCAKCGTTMQNESILSNDEYRARIHFKCYQCGNEVVVNRWWDKQEEKPNPLTFPPRVVDGKEGLMH